MPVGFRTRWPPEWTLRLLELVGETPGWKYAIFTRSVIQQKEMWKVYRDINISLYEEDEAWQRGMKADGLVVCDPDRGWIATEKWDSHVHNPVANKIYMLKAMMDKEEAVQEFGIDPNWTSFDQLPKSKRVPFQKLYPYYFLLREMYTNPPAYAPLPPPRTRSANAAASSSRPKMKKRRLKSKPVEVKRESEPESEDEIVEIEPVKRVYPPPIVVDDSSDEDGPGQKTPKVYSRASSSSSSPSPLRSPHWRPALLDDSDGSSEESGTSQSPSSSRRVGSRKEQSPTASGVIEAKPDIEADRRKRYRQKRAQGEVIPIVATNRKRGRSRA